MVDAWAARFTNSTHSPGTLGALCQNKQSIKYLLPRKSWVIVAYFLVLLTVLFCIFLHIFCIVWANTILFSNQVFQNNIVCFQFHCFILFIILFFIVTILYTIFLYIVSYCLYQNNIVFVLFQIVCCIVLWVTILLELEKKIGILSIFFEDKQYCWVFFNYTQYC